MSLLGMARPSAGQAQILGWGEQVVSTAWHQEVFVQVAGGDIDSLARRGDGFRYVVCP
ncbi:MAG: hypothetical protein ABI054_06150 [Planctomycetota bacterium]